MSSKKPVSKSKKSLKVSKTPEVSENVSPKIPEASQINVFEKSLCLLLKKGKFGDKVEVDSKKIEFKESGKQPDSKEIGVHKRIISCDEYSSIVSLDNAIIIKIKKYAIQSPFKGIYIIPFKTIEKVDELVQKYIIERSELVQKFLAVYETSVKQAQIRLGNQFNISDYISKEDVEKTFYVKTNYINFGVPENLQNISPEIFQREKDEFSTKLQSAYEEIQQALRASMAGLVDHMVDRLSIGADGKPKSFKKALVENFREFLTNFDLKDITEDSELSKLVKQAQDLLSGVSPEDLRTQTDIRNNTRDGFEKIKAKLDTMVVSTAVRAFDFSEEE